MIFFRKIRCLVARYLGFSGQSFDHSTLVDNNCRVVVSRKLLVFTTLGI